MQRSSFLALTRKGLERSSGRVKEMTEDQWIQIAKILGFENYPEGSDSWIFQGRHYNTRDIPHKVTEFMVYEIREWGGQHWK